MMETSAHANSLCGAVISLLSVKQEHCDPNSLFVFELHVWCEHDSLVLVCCVMFVALSMLDIMKISICCMSLLITS